MPDQKKTPKVDGLKILIEEKVLNSNITLQKLIEITQRLSEGDDNDAEYMWKFIVKGKFIYMDDTPAAAK